MYQTNLFYLYRNTSPMPEKLGKTHGLRLPESIEKFYLELATKERRTFLEMIRIVLEDHKALMEAKAEGK